MWRDIKTRAPVWTCSTTLTPSISNRFIHNIYHFSTTPRSAVYLFFLDTLWAPSSCLLKKWLQGKGGANKHQTRDLSKPTASVGLMSQELLAAAAARPVWTCDLITQARWWCHSCWALAWAQINFPKSLANPSFSTGQMFRVGHHRQHSPSVIQK